MTARTLLLLLSSGVVGLGCASQATVPEPGADALGLVSQLESTDAVVRSLAVAFAGMIGPAAIVPVSVELTSSNPDVAHSAELALWCIAHRSCRADADTERAQSAAACLQLLSQQPPLAARSRLTLVEMLGVLANDSHSIEQLAMHAAQPDIGEAVVRALERIAHPAAERELVVIARDHMARYHAHAIAALAVKSDAASANALLDVAVEGDADRSRTARHALALRGEAGAQALLVAAARSDERHGIDDLFAFAERRARSGDANAARTIYLAHLESPAAHVRAAAILGIGTVANPDITTRLVARLADDAADVRGAAEQALRASADRDLNEQLRRTVAAGPTAARTWALRLLVQRHAEHVQDLLRAAATDPQPDLRSEALRLLGSLDDHSVAAMLLAHAEHAAAEESEIALDSYLAHAEAVLRSGQAATALPMVHRVIAMRAPSGVTARALRSVAMIASPTSLPILESLESRDDCRDELVRARFAIARAVAATDRPTAVATLKSICGAAGSRRDRQRAAAKLTALGVDTSDLGRSRGFLADWHVIGAFREAAADDFEQHPFGDGEIALEAAVTSQGSERHWQSIHTTDIDGIVDLTHTFATGEHASAFAHAEIDSPAPGPATIKLGSDDGVAVWLNGTLVLAKNTWRGLSVDEDAIPVTLREGKNSLLLKVNQGSGDWGFCVRVEH